MPDMTTHTPDAVREASWTGDPNKLAHELRRVANSWGPGFQFPQLLRDAADEIDCLSALDSRAGDAGEGDRYTQGYARGQADAAQLHQWMQDKAWQDTVLMLVHYQTLAERTWLVGHEAATAKLAEWWQHARALSETKSVKDIAATPAPAVDAVPAGEVEAFRRGAEAMQRKLADALRDHLNSRAAAIANGVTIPEYQA